MVDGIWFGLENTDEICEHLKKVKKKTPNQNIAMISALEWINWPFHLQIVPA